MLAMQRTFREIMFLQELNSHDNIIRSARFPALPFLSMFQALPFTCVPCDVLDMYVVHLMSADQQDCCKMPAWQQAFRDWADT